MRHLERLHNTMLKAFSQNDATAKQADFVKEYEVLNEMHRKEMAEVVNSYEVQITMLKEKNETLVEKLGTMS